MGGHKGEQRFGHLADITNGSPDERLTRHIQIDSFLAEKDEIFEAVFDVAAEYEETDEVPSDAQRQEL